MNYSLDIRFLPAEIEDLEKDDNHDSGHDGANDGSGADRDTDSDDDPDDPERESHNFRYKTGTTIEGNISRYTPL